LRLPSYTRSLLLFQMFNGCNFTIALGAPMVLTARFLGAGESAIGALIALTPFLATLQMFSTELAERWGYRRLMVTCWSGRAFMLLLVVPLPFLTGRLSPGLLVAGLFVPLFAFNAIRGVAACAWFPWIRELIPADRRGYFLGLEQRVVHGSVLVTLLLSGWFLGTSPQGWRFSALFAAAWGAGLASALVLTRIPDRMPEASRQRSSRSVRARLAAVKQVWAHKPFRRVTRFGALSTFAQAAIPGFLVLYLRDELGWPERTILLFGAGSTLGVFMIAVLWGRWSDRVGSRPLLRLVVAGQMVLLSAWVLFATGVLGASSLTVGPVYILTGVLFASQAIALIRLFLSACPENETTLGIMVYQVTACFFGGCAPVLWGFALRGLRRWAGAEPGATSLPFAVFFVVALVLLGAAQLLLSRIPEPEAMPTRRLLVQVLWGWPLRVLSGFTAQDR